MQSWFPGGTTLTWLDFCLLAALIAALLYIAYRAGRAEENTSDFFLGRRRIPAWAACLSFLASEVSAMTIIGVPAIAYRENWQYLQFYIGSAAARVVIAYLFIPAFYRYHCTSIYEFLRYRFGARTQYAASILFFITRLLGSGVRLMAACVAVAVLLGWHLGPAIILFTAISVAYIGFGGIKAVVWTNVLQSAVFIVSGIVTLLFLFYEIAGGFSAIRETAASAGRLDLWNLGLNPKDPDWLVKFFSDPNILWIAVFNGFFGSLAAFGADQEQMQPLLTVQDRRASQWTMLGTIAASFFVTALYLAVGTGIYVYYTQHPEMALTRELDKIYPHFAVQVMPVLMRGLVLSAIFMASIDSPLASLSTSFVTDLYRPLIHPKADERHYLFVSRVGIVAAGILLAIIAYVFSFQDKMLWLGFKIGGVTLGSLLGVFLLGFLTKRHADMANVAAMTIMSLVNLGLLILSERGTIPLGWGWLVLIGTAGTFGIAWLYGPILDGEPEPIRVHPAAD